MGGTVAETIRRENGEVIKMARKTGAYNWMFFTKEFGEKQFDVAIDNHIKAFLEMKEDYHTGKPYKMPMTSVYGWCDGTYPIDYGLIVIDFKHKKIHSMQGYDTPGYHYVSMLSNNVLLDKDTEENFDYLLQNNLLYIIEKYNDNNIKDINQYFGKNFSLQKLRSKLDKGLFKNIFNQKNVLHKLVIYPKAFNDFECIMYPETPQGSISLLENLIQDDFSFMQEEFNVWKEKINSFDNDYFLEESDNEIEDEFLLEKKIQDKKIYFLNEIDSLQEKNTNTKIQKPIMS